MAKEKANQAYRAVKEKHRTGARKEIRDTIHAYDMIGNENCQVEPD